MFLLQHVSLYYCLCGQIDNIHRSGCSAVDISADGRHLVTAGDKVVKVWDYNMRLDLNFQVKFFLCLLQTIFTRESSYCF